MTLLKPKNIIPYKLFGIIGKPLQHSLSPKIQNRLFQQHKLPYIYLPFCLEEKHLKNLREVMRLCDIWGLNVTAPYKIKVLRYLDNLDKSAKEAGATNTIVRRGDKLIGYNTDGAGWWQSMKENTNFNPKGSFAIIIGAGGAARPRRHHVQVDGRGLQALVAQQLLDGAQIGARFQQVRGETVPHGVGRDPLRQPGRAGGRPALTLHGGRVERSRPVPPGKEPGRVRARGLPVRPQLFE